MEHMLPYVSVIIPVFNDGERLGTCLEALEQQTYPRSLYEAIVVDNGSEQSVEPIVSRYSQARAGQELRPGSYAARNKGLSLAKGQVLAFTDSDCIPAGDWLERGVAHLLNNPRCGLVGGRIDLFCRDPLHPTAVELYDSTRGLRQKRYIEVRRFAATANAFTFRSVVEKVGRFDSELKSCGDAEWGQRIAAAGYELIYADDARVAHPARERIGALLRKVTRVTGGWHDLNSRKRSTRRHVNRTNNSSFLRELAATLRDSRLRATSDRLRVAGVMVVVECVRLGERIRLNLGGAPIR